MILEDSETRAWNRNKDHLETLPTTGRDSATAITHDNKYLKVAGGQNDAY